jgi:hypothetical protein
LIAVVSDSFDTSKRAHHSFLSIGVSGASVPETMARFSARWPDRLSTRLRCAQALASRHY